MLTAYFVAFLVLPGTALFIISLVTLLKRRRSVIFAFSCQNAKIYIHRWIYVMWTYVHREFFYHIWAVYQCVEL